MEHWISFVPYSLVAIKDFKFCHKCFSVFNMNTCTLLLVTADDLQEQGRYTTGCGVNSDSGGPLAGYLSVLHNHYLIHLQFQLYAPHVHVLDTPFTCCPFNKGSKRGENSAVVQSFYIPKTRFFDFYVRS